MTSFTLTWPCSNIRNYQDLGRSKEASITKERYKEALQDPDYYEIPVSRRSLAQEFYGLSSEWQKDVKHFSSVTEMALHPAYQQIIGLGKDVLPLILNELTQQSSHWFWALKAITGIDPVPTNQRGNIRQMTQAWLLWAKENKINY
ncbi:MAG: hypothetical protein HY811_02890 [Planctomycetes bacterium]|nr:hypothetical protein [Planctomycetota bacterium]